MSNTPSRPSAPPAGGGPGIPLKGGAAILAPITAFPNGVPGNALVLLPINPNGTPVEKKIVDGPVRSADGRGVEAPRLQRPRGAGAGRAGPAHRDRPRGPARRPREALERQPGGPRTAAASSRRS